jgi:hypothetical protein
MLQCIYKATSHKCKQMIDVCCSTTHLAVFRLLIIDTSNVSSSQRSVNICHSMSSVTTDQGLHICVAQASKWLSRKENTSVSSSRMSIG